MIRTGARQSVKTRNTESNRCEQVPPCRILAGKNTDNLKLPKPCLKCNAFHKRNRIESISNVYLIQIASPYELPGPQGHNSGGPGASKMGLPPRRRANVGCFFRVFLAFPPRSVPFWFSEGSSGPILGPSWGSKMAFLGALLDQNWAGINEDPPLGPLLA